MNKNYEDLSYSEAGFKSLIDDLYQYIQQTPKDQEEILTRRMQCAAYVGDSHMQSAVAAWISFILQSQKYKMSI